MSTEEPPPFQEAPRCDVCKCSFNTFRRRHHCRCCGRTLCNEHSSNYMVLPQFGILSNVRVCADCFNDSTRSKKFESQVSVEGADSVTDKVSRLDIDVEKHPKLEPTTLQQSTLGDIECKCGMPLCICEAPTTKTDPVPMQTKPSSTFTSQSNPKPKKTDAALKNRGSTSSSKPRYVHCKALFCSPVTFCFPLVIMFA
ncbi:hypothetical protein OIU76_009099 [Salix suchowensis]|nr:hypothetical protein OIU76_009099 [Salix suchowensis]